MHSEGYGSHEVTRTIRQPRATPLWRVHDGKAQKSGQRRTIYWVGKSIMGEDGSDTGVRTTGANYHGEWHDNKKSGYGVQVFPNGEKYEGQWGKGMRNGEGTLWVPSQKSKKLRKLYVGGWKDDKRHGRGTCYLKSGEFFQGSWESGRMHGEGTLRYANGDLYVGEWHDGVRSGRGTLNKANGDCYEGFWLCDKREGSGSFFYAESGKVFSGEWADDLPKAGVYTQAQPNPEQAQAVPVTFALPEVELANPDAVLEGALAAVRNARKSHRAQNTPVTRLFSEDEIEALRNAFANHANPDSGYIQTSELQALCSSLGTEVDAQRLDRLLDAAGLRVEAAEAASGTDIALAFEDFLRVVALLLDEEAENNPPQPGAGQPGLNDFWDTLGSDDLEFDDEDADRDLLSDFGD